MRYINNLPSQFTQPFNQYDTSQCSWFTMEVVKNLSKIVSSIKKNDLKMYRELISHCLKIGTEKRLSNYKYKLGENIDQVIGSDAYDYYVCESECSIEQISAFIPDAHVLKRNYKKLNENELRELFIDEIKKNGYVVVNKHGESFTIAGVDTEFAIIDSHKSNHLIGSMDDVIKYVIDDYHGFFYILIGVKKLNI